MCISSWDNFLRGDIQMKSELDKFYTKPEVSLKCLSLVDLGKYDLVIEPSAGDGSFFNQIAHSNKLGLDIAPEGSGIEQQDWLEYKVPTSYKEVLIIGNPPFGLRNSLSKKFVEHSCGFRNVRTVAFVLPDVWNKHTLQKSIGKDFRIKSIVPLGRNSFLLNDKQYHVPCSFFVFDRSEGEDLRFDPSKYKETDDWCYGNRDDYDFFVLGAAANNVKEKPSRTNRGYYIKCKNRNAVEEVEQNFKNGIWKGYSSANGGVNWLTKAEIVKGYMDQIDKG
jgi:hypothetical protein